MRAPGSLVEMDILELSTFLDMVLAFSTPASMGLGRWMVKELDMKLML